MAVPACHRINRLLLPLRERGVKRYVSRLEQPRGRRHEVIIDYYHIWTRRVTIYLPRGLLLYVARGIALSTPRGRVEMHCEPRKLSPLARVTSTVNN